MGTAFKSGNEEATLTVEQNRNVHSTVTLNSE